MAENDEETWEERCERIKKLDKKHDDCQSRTAALLALPFVVAILLKWMVTL